MVLIRQILLKFIKIDIKSVEKAFGSFKCHILSKFITILKYITYRIFLIIKPSYMVLDCDPVYSWFIFGFLESNKP